MIAVALLLGQIGTSMRQAVAQATYTVLVQAADENYDTGITVGPGDTVTINAVDTNYRWTIDKNDPVNHPQVTADGEPGTAGYPASGCDKRVRQVPNAMLLMRMEPNNYWIVGTETNVPHQISTGGKLYFTTNDCLGFYGDNAGFIPVSFTVTRGVTPTPTATPRSLGYVYGYVRINGQFAPDTVRVSYRDSSGAVKQTVNLEAGQYTLVGVDVGTITISHDFVRAGCTGSTQATYTVVYNGVQKGPDFAITCPAATATATAIPSPTATATVPPTATPTPAPTCDTVIMFVHGWQGFSGKSASKVDFYGDGRGYRKYEPSYVNAADPGDVPLLYWLYTIGGYKCIYMLHWETGPDYSAPLLTSAIAVAAQMENVMAEYATSPNTKFVAITHSMGGPIMRMILEGESWKSTVVARLDKFISLGSPNLGLPWTIRDTCAVALSVIGKSATCNTTSQKSLHGILNDSLDGIYGLPNGRVPSNVAYYAIAGDSSSILARVFNFAFYGGPMHGDFLIPIVSSLALPGLTAGFLTSEDHSVYKPLTKVPYYGNDRGDSPTDSYYIVADILRGVSGPVSQAARDRAEAVLRESTSFYTPFAHETHEIVMVTAAVSALNFRTTSGKAIVAIGNSSYFEVSLQDPNGRVYDTSQSTQEVSVERNDDVTVVTVDSVPGIWKVVSRNVSSIPRIIALSLWYNTTTIVQSTAPRAVQPLGKTVNFSITLDSVSGGTGLRKPQVTYSGVITSAIVTVTAPDGSSHVQTATDVSIVTSQEGQYRVEASVAGTVGGEYVERQLTDGVLVAADAPPPKHKLTVNIVNRHPTDSAVRQLTVRVMDEAPSFYTKTVSSDRPAVFELGGGGYNVTVETFRHPECLVGADVRSIQLSKDTVVEIGVTCGVPLYRLSVQIINWNRDDTGEPRTYELALTDLASRVYRASGSLAAPIPFDVPAGVYTLAITNQPQCKFGTTEPQTVTVTQNGADKRLDIFCDPNITVTPTPKPGITPTPGPLRIRLYMPMAKR